MIWAWIKKRLANRVYDSLESMADAGAAIIGQLTPEIVPSITGWKLYNDMQILDV